MIERRTMPGGIIARNQNGCRAEVINKGTTYVADDAARGKVSRPSARSSQPPKAKPCGRALAEPRPLEMINLQTAKACMRATAKSMKRHHVNVDFGVPFANQAKGSARACRGSGAPGRLP